MSCGVGRRCSSDPALLWLWCWPAATALIRPLAWDPPYAAGAALEKTKKKNKKNNLLLIMTKQMKGFKSISLSWGKFLHRTQETQS